MNGRRWLAASVVPRSGQTHSSPAPARPCDHQKAHMGRINYFNRQGSCVVLLIASSRALSLVPLYKEHIVWLSMVLLKCTKGRCNLSAFSSVTHSRQPGSPSTHTLKWLHMRAGTETKQFSMLHYHLPKAQKPNKY